MRHNRRLLAIAVGLFFFAFVLSGTPAATPELAPIDITSGTAGKPVSLGDRLVLGLRARLKSEVNFCNEVAVQVQLGLLPQRLVDETFFWARQRATASRNGIEYRPIVFFQPAMKLRAAKVGVVLTGGTY